MVRTNVQSKQPANGPRMPSVAGAHGSVRVFAAALVLAFASGCGPTATKPVKKPSVTRAQDLAAARELDQEGVRAFTDGRFRTAMEFFDAASKLGGPASELWNMAKCQQKLEDGEGAASTIERYLARKDLSVDDRAEANRELGEIRRRPSRVTVITEPAGATVVVDDKRQVVMGKSPTSFDLAPGDHTLRVELPGHSPTTKSITTNFGRPIIVELSLSKS